MAGRVSGFWFLVSGFPLQNWFQKKMHDSPCLIARRPKSKARLTPENQKP
jgi:hypothetical protein